MTAVAAPVSAPAATPAPRRGPVLAVVLLAAFVIQLSVSIVNVALPALGRDLHAGTSSLQWVVDGYALSFAALVLSGGAVGDRYGRRGTLAGGLAGFAATAVACALAGSTGALITSRVLMGVAAAFIFPTTLSIITRTFEDRAERAKAIAAWGAVTGAAVAVGPVVGGLLLAHLGWSSVFWLLVPLAAAGALGTMAVVPAEASSRTGGLDLQGLVAAAAGLGALVYTIIEGPDVGWASARTLGGFAVAAAALVALALVERRSEHPMLDVRLFTNPRFSAASGSISLAFFALFGFIFLIILYFQVTRGWSALSAGARTLPVAISLAGASGASPKLAGRLGTRAVVSAGLAMLAVAFTWIATLGATTSYVAIVGQMVLLGVGMALTTTPATESIMAVVRPEQAGAGSAVNDATREVGGTLGVAVIGSVYASLYASRLRHADLPLALRRAAAANYPATRAQLAHLPAGLGHRLVVASDGAFLHGLHAGCLVAAATCAAAAIGAAAVLPRRAAAGTLS